MAARPVLPPIADIANAPARSAKGPRSECSLKTPCFVLRGTPAQRFRCAVFQTAKDTIMDREHVKGAADKAKGAIKEGAGKLTGDKDLEAEGKIDKAKGSAHNAAGDVKDAARDAADALKK
jgi:uncharacterized protein YjbJ (UPF0337 family)